MAARHTATNGGLATTRKKPQGKPDGGGGKKYSSYPNSTSHNGDECYTYKKKGAPTTLRSTRCTQRQLEPQN